jgi:hypothetical protein
MKSKLIIHVHDDINHRVALELVSDVIKQGLISKTRNGDQYCFVTTFMKDTYRVYARKSKGETHSFEVNKGNNND